MTEPPLRDAQAPAPEITCVRASNPGPMTLTGTNSYVVRDGDQVWFVDPGPRDAEHLDTLVRAGGLDRGMRPAGVIVTHRHVDHSEAAGTLRRRLTGIAGGDVPLWAVDTETVAGSRTPPGRIEGERGIVGHVLHLPGHTADSIGLLVEGGRLLVGDTLLGGSSTVIAPPDGDLTEYLRSLHVLRALCLDGRVSEILPGHGPSYRDPASALAAVEQAIAHREERIEAVRRARARGLLTMPRLLSEIYGPELPEGLREAAEANLRATLAHLARDS